MLELVLYGRPGCHLCDEMEDVLRGALAGREFRLRKENVDTRADWREQYGTRIPVLTLENGEELCHYRLTDDALHRLYTWRP